MIAATSRCLTADQYAAVLSGELPAAEFESAVAHLDHCPDCQSAIEKIPLDELSRQRFVSDDSLAPVETACQIALARMLTDRRSRLTDDPANITPVQSVGPYKLLGTLGRGGMGTVCLAEHQRLFRKCAIKFLPQHRVDEAGWLDRFNREMKSIASLEHPHIVQATDAGHDDGWHYLVMQYLDGLDVGRIASRLKRLEIADACEIIRQAALGISHIHQASLVHRDIKPSNLMLTRNGTVKVLDLGLVLAGDDPLASDDRLTTVGHLMGTMPYMAPEQLLDSRNVAMSTDIYGRGATLYRLISGRLPHPNRRGLAAQVLAIANDPTPRLPEVPAELADMSARMLDRDPTNRPTADLVAQSMEQFAVGKDLATLLERAESIPDETSAVQSAVPPSLEAASTNPMNRRFGRSGRDRFWIGLMGGFLAASLLLAGGFIIKLQTERGELVIESEVAGVTIAIKRGETIVNRLTADVGDNRLTLRQGTYVVEIEGAGDEFKLSDNRILISAKETAKLALTKPIAKSAETIATPESSDNQVAISEPQKATEVVERLYQGKTFATWLDVLAQEQDIRAIGSAVTAIEILAVSPEQHYLAASETLELTRKWGGIVADRGSMFGIREDNPNVDPSEYYMATIVDIFPKYMPSPGLELLSKELELQDPESRAAVVLLLKTYVDGIYDFAQYLDKRALAREEIQIIANAADSEPYSINLLEKLLYNLGRGVLDCDLNNYHQQTVADAGFETAWQINEITDGKLTTSAWLVDYAKKRLPIAQASYYAKAHTWSALPAAAFDLGLDSANSTTLQLNPEFVVACLWEISIIDGSRTWRTSWLDEINQLFSDQRMSLLAQHRKYLTDIASKPDKYLSPLDGGMPRPGRVQAINLNASPQPYFESGYPERLSDEFIGAVIRLLATDEIAPQASLEVLKSMKSQYDPNTAKPVLEFVMPIIDDAIKTLQQSLTS